MAHRRSRRHLSLTIGVVLLATGCQDQPKQELPKPPPSVPSPTAKRGGYKENKGFSGPDADYSEPGYVGDWNDRAGEIDVDTTAPQCDKPYVIQAGDTQKVADCATAPANYKTLCDNAFDKARDLCAALCKKNTNCQDPHLRPHVYEEWGCFKQDPNSNVGLVPHQYCAVYETCTCTRGPN